MTQTLRFPRGLYGITPEWDDTNKLLDAVSDAHRGGMTVLQWRRKLATPELATTQLEALLERCKQLQLPLLINDDWELACHYHADGAHLGKDDGSLTMARAALPAPKFIGASCYNSPDIALQALQKGVDYIAFGAMFTSTVKPNAPRALPEHIQQGLAHCQAYATAAGRPAVVAIGGITVENAASVIQAGADTIAVISSLFEAPNVYQRAQAFTDLFTENV
ncbi:thiamine phosphate synthase [Paenalcaligenes suwonensis]|uniref:thiamine phosphate synthase n=1 Tax=Paenalcaligenes suwonensis TaxID=1202713 RepID=UPI0014095DA0|nr:thiamine phosphate synthase [Paenalcaligenes suwonensis]NHC60410.1 thiamine phosphate synthase [Paenalcaligenes suwonensis]